jgi:death-on-curing protein
VKPRWVPREAVLAIHGMLIAEHGGRPGLLSASVLEASLASPRNLLAYGNPSVFDLAARCAFALARNHPFIDGNQREALTVAGVFLELNARTLDAPESEAVELTTGLSEGSIDEAAFAAWLRERSRSTAPPRPRSSRTRRKR